ncbi:MAG TPA: pyruvate carboxylase subunit B [Candidatus Micrarchaeaceae archaeon]|nr:pyruvate carboxylase subunit B [Candidatus Micrarchaeaceae archaeon]
MAPIGLIESCLRHGQQTLLLSRVRTRHLLSLLAKLEGCGYAGLDVFGGATFEVSLEHLGEDPFERLRSIRANTSVPLVGLIRGQSLVGYRPLPDDAVDSFVSLSAECGLDVFRCFDPLNDARNLAHIAEAVRAVGKHPEGTLVFTESPVHSEESFIALGMELAGLGYQSLCVFDPAGLLGAGSARALVEGLRERTQLPVSVHCATITGQASFAYLAAAEAGARSLDVCLSPLAGGASLPSTEGVYAALRGTDLQPRLDERRVLAAADALDELMPLYQAISDPRGWQYDTSTLRTQLAPSVLEHLRRECETQGAQGKLPAVLEEIPRVRAEMGYPPLITPIAQVVVSQAVANVASGQRYLTVAQEVKDYFLGLFGQPPGAVDPEIQKLVIGGEEPITVRPAEVLEPALEQTRKTMARQGWAEPSDSQLLSFLLFPVSTAALLRGEARVERLEDEQELPGAVALPAAVVDGGDLSEPIGDAAAIPAEVAPAPPPPPAEPVPAPTPVAPAREFSVEVDGEVFSVRVTATDGAGLGGGVAVSGAGGSAPPPLASEGVKAPMQGLIARLAVQVGDQVTVGQTVVVLEAMKMQNEIPSDRSGAVTAVLVAVGQVVSRGDVLVQIA